MPLIGVGLPRSSAFFWICVHRADCNFSRVCHTSGLHFLPSLICYLKGKLIMADSYSDKYYTASKGKIKSLCRLTDVACSGRCTLVGLKVV